MRMYMKWAMLLLNIGCLLCAQTLAMSMPAKLKWKDSTYGMWTVLTEPAKGDKKVLCRCSCGNEKMVHKCSLPSGASVSCGCDRDAKTVQRSTRHGNAPRSGRSKEYRAWQEMMRRCYLKSSKHYKRYGGRGIKVCERWHSSANFIHDCGKKPSRSHSWGRVDNDGDYEPINCRWELPRQQGGNTSKCRYLQYEGHQLCLTETARRHGMTESLLRRRLNRGWGLYAAIKTPRGANKL